MPNPVKDDEVRFEKVWIASQSPQYRTSVSEGSSSVPLPPTQTQLTQTAHRIEIVKSWVEDLARFHDGDEEKGKEGEGAEQVLEPRSFFKGKRVVEIGCGQGDMTTVLASLVWDRGGKGGEVHALDPADLDKYGSPFTLAQAQSHISSTVLGERISWRNVDPLEYLSSEGIGGFDYAVLAHSIYYLPSLGYLYELFRALHRNVNVGKLLVAEWSNEISDLKSLPHLLSVLIQGLKPLEEGNVRISPSPSCIVRLATKAGWKLVEQEQGGGGGGGGSKKRGHLGRILKSPQVEDGKWEVFSALEVAKSLADLDDQEGSDEGQADQVVANRTLLHGLRTHLDCLDACLEKGPEEGGTSGIKNVKSMDVWTAVFVRG